MKRQTIIVLVTVFACFSSGFSDALAADLHTSARGRNVDDLTRDVAQWHDSKHPDCKFAKVVGAEIVKQESDSITEHWTIQACEGKQFTYRVYILRGSGAMTDMVSDVETHGAASGK